jgi:hypothetical protein
LACARMTGARADVNGKISNIYMVKGKNKNIAGQCVFCSTLYI